MSLVYKSSDLIRSIKRRGMIPSDQSTFSDSDFLEMLNEEIQYFGVPHLLRTHEEYLLTYTDVPIQSGKYEYPIPYRAIGTKLRDISYVDTNNSYFELSRISVEYLADYNTSSSVSDYPRVFYVKDNKIVLVDASPVNGVLRMYYYLKPNKLVEDNKAGIVTNIDLSGGVITLSSFPKAFQSNTTFDFIGAVSSNRILAFDKVITASNVNTKSLTFNLADIPDDLAIGDYINVKGETIVPQLPEELHPILSQRVAIAAMEALGDSEAAGVAQRKLDKMETSTNDIIDNRVEGAPEKIVNRHGTLRAATGYNKFRGR